MRDPGFPQLFIVSQLRTTMPGDFVSTPRLQFKPKTESAKKFIMFTKTNMKYLIVIGLACLLWSCKKSNNTPKTTPALSGKFLLYRKVDTSYLQGPGTNVVSAFIVLTLTGDTAYVNPGQKNYAVLPNEIPNYNPSQALADTLSFTSASVGAENGVDFPSAGKFTYDLNTGYFKIANINYSDVRRLCLRISYVGSLRLQA